jgi:hypothetical protein
MSADRAVRDKGQIKQYCRSLSCCYGFSYRVLTFKIIKHEVGTAAERLSMTSAISVEVTVECASGSSRIVR